MALRKDEKANLRSRYPIFVELGLILALGALILAFRVHMPEEEEQMQVVQEQETVQMEEIQQTQQQKEPPPPPKPPVPVEVPNDEELETEELDLDASLDFDEPSQEQPPPPPPDEGNDEPAEPEIFQTVEQMPTMKPNNQEGMQALRSCIEYPQMAKRAGVEGRLTVQFVVDEQGNVQQPRILGNKLGAGLDKEAIRCVRERSFNPGKQRGQPVKVQFALPVNFRLN